MFLWFHNRMEPNNGKTIEAISRLENALVAKLENHLELEAEDVPDSDDEVTWIVLLYNARNNWKR